MAASHASGSTARRVLIAVALGVVSHIIMDAIPHADYGFLPRRRIPPIVLAETAVVFALAAVVLRRRLTKQWLWFIGGGLFGSAAPDSRFGLDVLGREMKYEVLFATYWFHSFFHAGPVVFWIGMSTQVTAALACMACLFAFPRVSVETADSRDSG
jgi:hypothetical protein